MSQPGSAGVIGIPKSRLREDVNQTSGCGLGICHYGLNVLSGFCVTKGIVAESGLCSYICNYISLCCLAVGWPQQVTSYFG